MSAERITREAFEAFIRAACDSPPLYDQLLDWGFSIKPCSCDYDGCHGWVFTCDDPVEFLRRASATLTGHAL